MSMETTGFGSSGGYWDIRGSSEEDKPSENVPIGSTFYEIDGDHNIYMFDGTQWVLQR